MASKDEEALGVERNGFKQTSGLKAVDVHTSSDQRADGAASSGGRLVEALRRAGGHLPP